MSEKFKAETALALLLDRQIIETERGLQYKMDRDGYILVKFGDRKDDWCRACAQIPSYLFNVVKVHRVYGTYSWEREECHRCRLYACCVGLDECRQKINGEWEEHCSAFLLKEEEE